MEISRADRFETGVGSANVVKEYADIGLTELGVGNAREGLMGAGAVGRRQGAVGESSPRRSQMGVVAGAYAR